MPATDIPATELAAVVRAVRTRAAPVRPHPQRFTAFGLGLAIFLHMAGSHAWTSSTAPVGGSEENRMLITRSLAVVSSLALSSTALAQDAVQWRVEDGGNGHWYAAALLSSPMDWPTARVFAQALGGELASLGESGEFLAVVPQFAVRPELWLKGNWWRGPWIGAFQDTSAPDYLEPSSGWYWIDGTPVDAEFLQVFGAGNPNDFPCCEDYLQIGEGPLLAYVNDVQLSTTSISCIIEWSADCNNDGIVDYGQILDGSLEDLDGNGVPDCCQSELSCDPCRADIDRSGAVNGVDLAAVLNNWGTSGGKQPRSDVNADGIVNGADLAEVLNSWGVCP